MKFLSLSFFLFIYGLSNAQVGIGNTDPKASLDITGVPSNASIADGVIAPRITGNQLTAKDAVYTSDQTGAIVYITSIPTPTTTKTVNITSPGFYYFNGTVWIGLTSPGDMRLVNTSSHITQDAGIGSNGSSAGNENVIAIGQGAGHANIGSNNVFIGTNAGNSNTYGVLNTFLGNYSGVSATGSENTFLGTRAGSSTTMGNQNISIGAHTWLPDSLGSQQLNIGNIIYGNGINGVFNDVSLGNIGIGLKEPTARLHIKNDLHYDIQKIESSNIGGTYLNLKNNFSTKNWAIGNSGLGLQPGGMVPPLGSFVIADYDSHYPRLVIDSIGQVGIGHVYPTSTLDILSPNIDVLKIKSLSFDGTRFRIENTNNIYYWDFVNTATNNSDFSIMNSIFPVGSLTIKNNNKNALTLLPNGNVVVGKFGMSMTPGTLEVRDSSNTKIRIESTDNTGIYFSKGAGSRAAIISANDNTYFCNDEGSIPIGNDVDISHSKMMVKSTGKIGIGTVNPSSRLHIVGSPNDSEITINKIEGSSIFGTALELVNNFGSWPSFWEIKNYGNGNPFNPDYLMFTNNNGTKMMISGTGITSNLTGSWSTFSDARIKTVKSEFKDGLSIIKQINPVTFVYNENAPFKASQTQIGIVAQDLEKIAPYMVTKTANGEIEDLREVNNQAYVFLLINAVKEQQIEIENLKNEVKKLKE